jgi:Trp operon repressor
MGGITFSSPLAQQDNSWFKQFVMYFKMSRKEYKIPNIYKLLMTEEIEKLLTQFDYYVLCACTELP